MHIKYDKSLKIAGIGMVPWTRLGLERWFDNYKILSLQNWDLKDVTTLSQPYVFENEVQVAKKNAQQLVMTPAFKRASRTFYKDYTFLPYKPVEVPSKKLARRFAMNDTSHTKTFENKAYLRHKFADILPFPKFVITDKSALKASRAGFVKLQQLAPKFVLQHEQLSGGKGTFLVRDLRDYKAALSALPDGKIVVSELIEDANERSVQACATRYGTFVGPVQKQIIAHPSLCNLDLKNGSTFCGAEVGKNVVSLSAQVAIQDYAKVIGETMYKEGFRGIFGLDVLVKGDQVYVLEVNARITGVTPLLTALHRDGRDIPFYLLHALELSKKPYKITDTKVNTPQDGALLLLQNQQSQIGYLCATPQSGVYEFADDGSLTLIRKDTKFSKRDPKNALLIQAYVPVGTLVKPGDRLLAVITKEAVLDSDNNLLPEYVQLVDRLYATFKFMKGGEPLKGTGKRVIVGRTEQVGFPDYGLKSVEAKVDTGAASAVIHASNIKLKVIDGTEWLQFSPFDRAGLTITTDKFFTKRVRSSNGQAQIRYFIGTNMVLQGKMYPIVASLTDRSNMKFQMLIGRKFLEEQNMLVDLNRNKR